MNHSKKYTFHCNSVHTHTHTHDTENAVNFFSVLIFNVACSLLNWFYDPFWSNPSSLISCELNSYRYTSTFTEVSISCTTLTKTCMYINKRTDGGIITDWNITEQRKGINYRYSHPADESQEYCESKISIQHYSIYRKFKTATTKQNTV